MATQGQDIFQQRLARIHAGQFSRVPEPGVGDENKRAWATKKTVVSRSELDEAATGGHPLSFLWAFLVGILAHVLSQLAAFHFAGLPDPTMTADKRMAVDVLFAVGMVLSFPLFFDMPGKVNMLFKLLGVAASICLLHNLVHIFPGPFEAAFSWEWVRFITSVSEPQSLFFRGESFTLG